MLSKPESRQQFIDGLMAVRSFLLQPSAVNAAMSSRDVTGFCEGWANVLMSVARMITFAHPKKHPLPADKTRKAANDLSGWFKLMSRPYQKALKQLLMRHGLTLSNISDLCDKSSEEGDGTSEFGCETMFHAYARTGIEVAGYAVSEGLLTENVVPSPEQALSEIIGLYESVSVRTGHPRPPARRVPPDWLLQE